MESTPALFHRIVQQGQRGSGSVGADNLQTHFLQDSGHTVPHRGGGCQTQIHDAEGHTQTFGSLPAHNLAHAGDLEGGFLR